MKVVVLEHRKHNQRMTEISCLHFFYKVQIRTQDSNVCQGYVYELSDFIIRNYKSMSISNHVERQASVQEHSS